MNEKTLTKIDKGELLFLFLPTKMANKISSCVFDVDESGKVVVAPLITQKSKCNTNLFIRVICNFSICINVYLFSNYTFIDT